MEPMLYEWKTTKDYFDTGYKLGHQHVIHETLLGMLLAFAGGAALTAVLFRLFVPRCG